MLYHLRAWLSARRMGLRDKGMKEGWFDGDKHYVDVHAFCRTRVRIGIDKQGVAIQYCWRCESTNEDPPELPPKGREDLPEARPPEDAAFRTVVPLNIDTARKRDAAKAA